MDIQVRYDRDINRVISTIKSEDDVKDGDTTIGKSRSTIIQEIDADFAKQEYGKLNEEKNRYERQRKDHQLKADSIVLKHSEDELVHLKDLLFDLRQLEERDKSLQVVKNCEVGIKNMNEHINRLKPVIEHLKK
jgi:hypothetical protein